MLIDGVTTGTMIEIGWRQRRKGYRGSIMRKVQLILISPIHSNLGTVQQRLAGWNCHVIYDSCETRKLIPYNRQYEIKWLKLCESQGNLKIISQASVKDEKR